MNQLNDIKKDIVKLEIENKTLNFEAQRNPLSFLDTVYVS